MGIKILRQGLPVIGFCKIGEPTSKSGPRRGAPIKFDHIELTGVERDENGALIPDLDLLRKVLERNVATCGGCPRSEKLGFPDGLPRQLPIYLPYNDLELNLPNRLAYYAGRTAFCTGDGETAQRRTITGKRKEGGREVNVYGPAEDFGPCGRDCPDFLNPCKPNAKFKFILGTQENVGGCFEFRTTSWNSIANLREGLEMVQLMTGGILQWIPLLFEVGPQTVQPADGPANTAYIARVTFPGGPDKLLESVRDTLQLRAPLLGEIRQLEAQIVRGEWTETPEEIAAVEAEFYPGASNGGAPDEGGDPPGSPESTSTQGEEETEEAPEPAWCAVGDGEPITTGQVRILRAKANRRAMQLDLKEKDAGLTLLGEVLRPCGTEDASAITQDRYDEFVVRLEAYQFPEASA